MMGTLAGSLTYAADSASSQTTQNQPRDALEYFFHQSFNNLEEEAEIWEEEQWEAAEAEKRKAVEDGAQEEEKTKEGEPGECRA